MRQWRGRLAFHGGLSTQHLLPHGTPAAVAAETRRLLAAGAGGGYIFAPAHAIEGDVPAENILAMLEVVRAQPGWQAVRGFEFPRGPTEGLGSREDSFAVRRSPLRD
jgi:hypothetical protein